MRGSREAAQKALFTALPNGVLGNPAAMPVHLVDGKWYVDVKPSGWTRSDLHDVLKIEEQLEQGSMKYDKVARRISVWDDGQWRVFDELGFDTLNIPHETTLSPSALQALKDWQAERDDEDERRALRRALEEIQADEELEAWAEEE